MYTFILSIMIKRLVEIWKITNNKKGFNINSSKTTWMKSRPVSVS